MTVLPSVPKDAALDPTTLRAVGRHLRIWRVFIGQALVREMQFRMNFLATIAVGAMQLGLALIPVFLLYRFTDTVQGWSRGDAIALIGMFQVVLGILCLFIQSNANDFHAYVQEGALDLVVVKPMSAQFYLMTRLLQPAEIFAVISGIAVLAAGLAGRGWPGMDGLARAALLVACGTTMLACIWCGISWLAFWTTSESTLPGLMHDIMLAGRYPVSFYPVALRAVFVGVIPIGFATTFPVEALRGGGSWWVVLGGVALTGAILVLLRAWWRFAIRSYTSASS